MDARDVKVAMVWTQDGKVNKIIAITTAGDGTLPICKVERGETKNDFLYYSPHQICKMIEQNTQKEER